MRRLSSGLRVALVGAMCGAFVAIGELLLVVLRRYGLHQIVYLGAHAAWMTPAADLLLFSVLGAGVGAAVQLLPSRHRVPVAAALLASAAALALLLHVVWLDWRAQVLVALGAGVQVGRALSRRWPAVERLARLTVPIAVVATAVLGVGMARLGAWREARLIARLPTTPSDAPNILWLVLDTVRALNLGVYGYPNPTSPHLDSLAGQGVLFERAYATSSWTLPSHGSFFTGREAHELSAEFLVPLDATYPTIAERLAAQGYATGAFMANQRYGNAEWGLARGFDHFEVYPVTLAELPLNASIPRRLLESSGFRHLIGYHDILNRMRAQRVNADALTWIGVAGRRPFFAFLNYFDAHEPYLPPPPYSTAFSDAPPSPSRASEYFPRVVSLQAPERRKLSPRERDRQRGAYDGGLRYMDEAVGQLLAELGRRGGLKNTIVIITSDHGEHLGESDRFLHAFDLFAPALHVPLILVYPAKIEPGSRVADPVSLADLPATLADLSGLGGRLALPGRSILPGPQARDSSNPRRPVLASLHSECRGEPRFSLIVGPHQYIRDGACGEYLYDLVTDPYASRNLIGTPGSEELVRTYRSQGEALLTRGIE